LVDADKVLYNLQGPMVIRVNVDKGNGEVFPSLSLRKLFLFFFVKLVVTRRTLIGFSGIPGAAVRAFYLVHIASVLLSTPDKASQF
jgi:hypothetical protein